MAKNLIERIGADKIISVCKSSKTFKEACEQLNCGYRYLLTAAIELGVYNELKAKSKKYSHKREFKSCPWKVKCGKGGFTSYKIDDKIWCEELFKGTFTANAYRIKQHLIAAGLKEDKCDCCGISEWNGKPITIQCHHKDGNTKNNKLENLEFLCPNCHSQTDNYGSKNVKNKENLNRQVLLSSEGGAL